MRYPLGPFHPDKLKDLTPEEQAALVQLVGVDVADAVHRHVRGSD